MRRIVKRCQSCNELTGFNIEEQVEVIYCDRADCMECWKDVDRLDIPRVDTYLFQDEMGHYLSPLNAQWKPV